MPLTLANTLGELAATGDLRAILACGAAADTDAVVDEAPECAWYRAWAHVGVGQLSEALHVLQLLEAAAARHEHVDRWRTRVHLGLALVAEARGEYASALEAIDIGLRHGFDLDLRGQLRTQRGKILAWQGRTEAAAAELAAAQEDLERAEDSGARVWCVLERVQLALLTGHTGLADALLASVDQDVLGSRDRILHGRHLYTRGCLAQALDEALAALSCFEHACRLLRSAGHVRGEAATQAQMAACHDRLGDHARGEAAFRAALDLRRSCGDVRGVAQSLNNRAHTLLTRGEADVAAVLAAAAVADLRRIDARAGLLIALCTLAQAELGCGRLEAARDAAEESVGLNAKPPLRAAVYAEAHDVLAAIARREGDADRERYHLVEARLGSS